MSPLYLLPYVILSTNPYPHFPIEDRVAKPESATHPPATISIGNEAGTILATEQTDETGRFGLTVVHPPAKFPPLPPPPPPPQKYSFRIGGTVVDGASTTVPQASISLHGAWDTILGTGQTDETGRFEFFVEAFLNQAVSLRVSAPGYYTEWIEGRSHNLGDVAVSLEYMPICRPAENRIPTERAIGPFNRVLLKPEFPDDRTLSRLMLGEMMPALTTDTTGYVVPLLDSESCSPGHYGYHDRCNTVSHQVPVAPNLNSAVPVSTFLRVEAHPLSKCIPKSDYVSPLRVDVTLSTGTATETATVSVDLRQPHWLPVRLAGQVGLAGGAWADEVFVEVAANAWDLQIPTDCNIDLRIWANYPDVTGSEADLLLADIADEIEYKQRMLDYAQFVVEAGPALRLIEAQMSLLLAELAVGTDEQLRDRSVEMVAALDYAITSVFEMAMLNDTDSEATQNALLELIDVLENLDEDQTWTDEQGNPLTIRQLLGEEDAAYVEAFSQRAGELVASAESDVARLPGEIADLNTARAMAQAQLEPSVFERETNILPSDGIVLAEGQVRPVGTSTFPRYLLEHPFGATQVVASAIGLELVHAERVRVAGTPDGNALVVRAYDLLDTESWLHGNLESYGTNAFLQTCDGTRVSLDSGHQGIHDGSLVRVRGDWDGDTFDVTRWGLLRSSR